MKTHKARISLHEQTRQFYERLLRLSSKYYHRSPAKTHRAGLRKNGVYSLFTFTILWLRPIVFSERKTAAHVRKHLTTVTERLEREIIRAEELWHTTGDTYYSGKRITAKALLWRIQALDKQTGRKRTEPDT